MLPTLRLLAGNGPQQEPARLLDLWLNAERRAAQGRYDDAVARVYRMIEWTGQWLLRTKLGADTADFAADLLPLHVLAHPDGDGKVKLGLWDAWQVVKSHLKPGPAHDLIANRGSELRDLLRIRNDSILAHGFTPVQKPFLGADGKLGARWVPAGSGPLRTCGRPEEAAGSASDGAAGVCAHSRGNPDLTRRGVARDQQVRRFSRRRTVTTPLTLRPPGRRTPRSRRQRSRRAVPTSPWRRARTCHARRKYRPAG